jgi:hypothetical protein
MVEHSLQNPKVEGLSLAFAVGTGIERIANMSFYKWKQLFCPINLLKYVNLTTYNAITISKLSWILSN